MYDVPAFTVERIRAILENSWGLTGRLVALPSERDQNFRVESSSGERFVLKVANRRDDPALIDAQNAAMSHLQRTVSLCPSLVPTRSGEPVLVVSDADGDSHRIRLLTYVDGIPLGKLGEKSPDLLLDLGRKLGTLDRAMQDFDHPALHRELHWDLAMGTSIIERYETLIADASLRRQIDHLVSRFHEHTAPLLDGLRRSVIHNDANDHNVIVDDSSDAVVGFIDLGDMVHGWTVGNLAIGIAYAILDSPEPLDVAATITEGYHSEFPLGDGELRALHGLVCLRLCTSACIAAHQMRERPNDPYLAISQEPIRQTLPKLVDRPFRMTEEVLRDACARRSSPAVSGHSPRPDGEVLAERKHRLSRSLRIAYRSPIRMSRGWMQYLFDTQGRRYLDAYNNVPHVGHCHPRVVEAATRQMRRLNTNTRYLYDSLGRLAERLAGTLPDPLDVCFFLNSASEANELAVRLARALTGGRDVIVQEAAYHGHTTTLIDMSPYKHDGPGGMGAPDWVHTVPVPDRYRGRYRDDDPRAAARYAGHVRDACDGIRRGNGRLAAFIAETFPSVGGQLVPPEGYLAAAYDHVRQAGGVCIADEVQTGYGRIGSAFYAFETAGVVPDIVVLGKPIGNGHPLAAVVTTRAIADSFDTGMEFFSTFGGNTVSCEVGLAVLDVVRDEELQEHALRVGQYLQEGLSQLARKVEAIGDVRGSGFFLGVELVRDRETREPAGDAAADVVNRLREAGVLIGTDGPHHNVLKIRPPMPFQESDADCLLAELDRGLQAEASSR